MSGEFILGEGLDLSLYIAEKIHRASVGLLRWPCRPEDSAARVLAAKAVMPMWAVRRCIKRNRLCDYFTKIGEPSFFHLEGFDERLKFDFLRVCSLPSWEEETGATLVPPTDTPYYDCGCYLYKFVGENSHAIVEETGFYYAVFAGNNPVRSTREYRDQLVQRLAAFTSASTQDEGFFECEDCDLCVHLAEVLSFEEVEHEDVYEDVFDFS